MAGCDDLHGRAECQYGLLIADRAYVLENGRIVLEGSDLGDDPRVREAYLGEGLAHV